MAVCNVVGTACVAPAGYRVNGFGYAPGLSYRLPRCYQCGEHVCKNCSVQVGRSRICGSCCEDQAKRILG